MAGKIEDYERLLRDLSLRTSDEDQSLIHRALNKVSCRLQFTAKLFLIVIRRVVPTPTMFCQSQASESLNLIPLSRGPRS